jgi:two-component system, chemotaxis family, CheB/CheR fusion protein
LIVPRGAFLRGRNEQDDNAVAEQIREQCGWKRPLLVAVTGYGMEADRLRSEKAGIDLHLVKPVEPEELKKLLSRFQAIVSVPAVA